MDNGLYDRSWSSKTCSQTTAETIQDISNCHLKEDLDMWMSAGLHRYFPQRLRSCQSPQPRVLRSRLWREACCVWVLLILDFFLGWLSFWWMSKMHLTIQVHESGSLHVWGRMEVGSDEIVWGVFTCMHAKMRGTQVAPSWVRVLYTLENFFSSYNYATFIVWGQVTYNLATRDGFLPSSKHKRLGL